MKFKRISAVILSMAITASMIPAFVSADESENVPETTTGTVESAQSKEKETEKPADKKPSASSETVPEKTKESKQAETSESNETEPSESEKAETSETKPEETVPSEAKPEETVPSQTAKRKSVSGYSGSFGKSLGWSFEDSTGVLTVSGTGAMPSYDNQYNTPWKDYRDSITEVVIESGVRNKDDRQLCICEQQKPRKHQYS